MYYRLGSTDFVKDRDDVTPKCKGCVLDNLLCEFRTVKGKEIKEEGVVTRLLINLRTDYQWE